MKNPLKIFWENEKSVFELYSIYDRKFGKLTSLWKELVEKEAEHVEILEDLYEKYGKNGEKFSVSKHLEEALGYVGNFVRNEIGEARKNKIKIFEAAEVSLRLEQSMIEKRSFELFKSKNQEILRVLKKLNRDTKDHVKMIKEDIRKNKY